MECSVKRKCASMLLKSSWVWSICTTASLFIGTSRYSWLIPTVINSNLMEAVRSVIFCCVLVHTRYTHTHTHTSGPQCWPSWRRPLLPSTNSPWFAYPPPCRKIFTYSATLAWIYPSFTSAEQIQRHGWIVSWDAVVSMLFTVACSVVLVGPLSALARNIHGTVSEHERFHVLKV